MKIQSKDYVLVALEGGKKSALVRVIEADDPKRMRGVVDQSHIDEIDIKGAGDPVTFRRSDVMANLGQRPKFGTAYGSKVEVLRSKASHDWFGTIRVFASVLDNEDLKAEFKKHLKSAEHLIRKNRLPQLPIIFDIRHTSGKYAGYYKYRRGKLDLLTIRLSETDIHKDYIHYVVTHEYAHGIWFRHVPATVKKKWIDLYHKATEIKKVKKDELERLCSDLVAAESLAAFKKEIDPEDRKLLAACFKQIKASHQLDVNHIQLLIGLEEDISDIWPTYVELGNPELILSDYARKSPEELFAEAVSFWLTGKKLPKQIQNAVDRTMTRLSKTDVDEADQSTGYDSDDE